MIKKSKTMKAINYILSFGIAVFSTVTMHAQEARASGKSSKEGKGSAEYKIAVQNTKDGKLTLNDFAGDLPVEGYSGTEIIITSDREGGTPDRAKGLKPVYADGTDNTGIGVSVEKNGNQITLTCLLPITQSADYKIKVPDNFSVNVDNECGHSGDVTVSNMKGEVEVKNCGAIKLKNVSGPLVLSTISGDIELEFSTVSKDRPVSINSISGEIDVTLPAKAGVDVEMETISGGIYSDFDFSSDKKTLRRIGGNNIKGQLNGGGVDFKLTNISGNIYLRKKGQ
jgi:lia operon protein LiaG